MVYVFVVLTVCSVLAVIHWYLWRRMVRDVSAPGSAYRRIGTALVVVLPPTMIAALISPRAGVPFGLQRIIAWPGYFWIALMQYLTMALLAGELLRPLLRWWLGRRDTAPAPADPAAPGAGAPAPGTRAPGTRAPGTRAPGTPAPGAVAVAAPAERSGPVGRPGARPAPALVAGCGASAGPAPESLRAEPGHITTADERSPAAAGTGDAGSAGRAGREPSRPGLTEPTAPSGSGCQPSGRVPERPTGPSRRLLVSRTVAVAAGAVAAGTVGLGAYGVFNGPTVKRITVPLAKLPVSAHGFRIAVVSDIHLGPILGRAHTQRIVDAINRTQPDLVTIVGDLVDGTVADLGPAAEPLTRLRSRHGSYFVTGNHEYYSGVEEWVNHVREMGVHPLRNARAELPAFDLAGVNDISGEEHGDAPDYEVALGDRDPARAVVLMAHQPVQIHEAVRHGVDLQLSGHTHGGQLWPGNYLASLANPTVAGLEQYGDTQLYVTRGAGTWGPPVRVGAESDITVVELASRQA